MGPRRKGLTTRTRYGMTDMLYSAGKGVTEFAAGMDMPSAIERCCGVLGSGAAGTLMTSIPLALHILSVARQQGASSWLGQLDLFGVFPYLGALSRRLKDNMVPQRGMVTPSCRDWDCWFGSYIVFLKQGNLPPVAARGLKSGDNWGIYRDTANLRALATPSNYARSAADSANDMFGKLGVNATIEHFYATTNSSLKGDRNGVASGGTIRAGGSVAEFGLMGLGGDRTAAAAGQKKQCCHACRPTFSCRFCRAFQTQVDSLPKVLADMIRGVDAQGLDAAGTVDSRATPSSPWTCWGKRPSHCRSRTLKNLSFDAAAGIIQLSGGLEGWVA